ncbi:hypothetical protein [Paraburkholderia hayleyella]|uniref:hypothetical protein n=1 Tax=Paraburkholderia hayleyella TaxID=2152889 RepID=UPI0015804B6F|nr:hypothetical protein [Paraburkholderia hayleyella]
MHERIAIFRDGFVVHPMVKQYLDRCRAIRPCFFQQKMRQRISTLQSLINAKVVGFDKIFDPIRAAISGGNILQNGGALSGFIF